MRTRLVRRLLRRRLASSPAVAIVGPRQCGKTTLAATLDGRRFDLEQPADRVALEVAWDEVAAARRLVVLDEAQAWPDVFPRLRAAIDADRRRNGRFLLLGSVSPALMREVSESLAGRMALVELTPFLASELARADLDRLWLRGGYPDGGILGDGAFPDWQRDYAALLAQRDLPAWGLPAKPQVTDRLLHMLAAVHGQAWNASQIGQSLGLSHHTVNAYLDFLEGAFLVRRVPPWLPNLRKRLVRSPRLFWRDTGLLHALLGVRTMDALVRQPWVGASWEGFVVQQVTGHLAALGHPVAPHWFRTADGSEVDLVLELGGHLWAIEVKLTDAPAPEDLARLDRAADLIGADRRLLVTRVARPAVRAGRGVTNVPDLLRRLGDEAAG